MVLLTFARLGVECQVRGKDVFVSANQSLRIEDDVQGAIPTIPMAFGPRSHRI